MKKEDKVYLVTFGFLVVTCVLMLAFCPPWQVSRFGVNATQSVDIATLENSYRLTLAQIFGDLTQILEGLAIIAGLILIYREILPLKDGQITERFTRAIEHLGKSQIELKLGGIYALERISKESENYYWPIMEILMAYIRENSRIEYVRERERFANERKVSSDVQAILNVIRRRKYAFNAGEPDSLDLQRTNLQEANLRMANLESSNLREANLMGADLIGANLARSNLKGANLEKTRLTQANLEGANLLQANLIRAYLDEANLKGTNLEGAILINANLGGANFEEAYNLTIYQLSRVKTLYNAKLDEELEKPLREKYPALFEKPEE